jgi:hypothetical protein
MKKNIKASSMIIAIWLVLISVLTAFTIIEYMIPFLKNVRWAQNSVWAYYNSYSWLEKWLYFISTRGGETEETSITSPNDEMIWYEYFTSSVWWSLPALWTWDSEFAEDYDYNTISMWNPIQLSIWNGYLKNGVENLSIKFRVPDLDKAWLDSDYNFVLKDTTEDEDYIINWQISSDSDTLNSTTWALITAKKINSDNSVDGFSLNSDFKWTSIKDGLQKTIVEFYNENCGDGKKCILRFSVINPLKLDENNIVAPYLEWKIKINWQDTIPLRYSRIESTWKSYWFKKSLEIRVPQDTISEALDFTVFQ